MVGLPCYQSRRLRFHPYLRAMIELSEYLCAIEEEQILLDLEAYEMRL